MITIAILREAGLSDAQILRILELEQSSISPGAERTRRWRERHRCDERHRDVTVTDVTPVTGHLEAHKPDKQKTIQDVGILTVTRGAQSQSVLSFLRREVRKEKKKERASQRGTRLSADWQPSDLDWQYALNTIGEPAAKLNLEKFRNYWPGLPGQRGTKLDWSGTWRNWVLRVAEQNSAPTVISPADQEVARNAAEQRRLTEEYERQKRQRRSSDQGELLG